MNGPGGSGLARTANREHELVTAAPHDDPQLSGSSLINRTWLQHMRRGEFEQAWILSDRALRERMGQRCEHIPRHFQWIWDGRPLEGRRVLVRCYHGLGDTIQFIRYMPVLRSIASQVIVWIQPSLIELCRDMTGIDLLLPLHDGAPDCDYDADVEIMELPHVFRTTLDTIPAAVPYLRVTPDSIPDDGRLAVGLFWKTGDWDPRRELQLDLLRSLGSVPGTSLYVLEWDVGGANVGPPFKVLPGGDTLKGAARWIAGLDLVISVDSMPAHLAGALGIPTWTLLHTDADWRWMEGRSDSPWYPTMRLFRQEQPSDWEPVVRRVASELRQLVATRISR